MLIFGLSARRFFRLDLSSLEIVIASLLGDERRAPRLG
jgi:hypothetical protein